MSKILCSMCYTKTATRIDNLYCEKCLYDLITELNTIIPKNIPKVTTQKQPEYRTIESEYFSDNKKYKR